MKANLGLLCAAAVVLSACSGPTYVIENPRPAYPPPPPPAYVEAAPLAPLPESGPDLSALEQLCAPIALYPDPLVSLILPAATFPDQVRDAASFVAQNGPGAVPEEMPWDSSVRGLAHYPTVVSWMASNPSWTSQLGGAFASEPAAVMDAIQELRRRARTVGSLVETPQQQIVIVGAVIEIAPRQPTIVYVPEYDPAVVYVRQPAGFYYSSYFHWSRPYACGTWLAFEFDWRAHRVWPGDWYDYHREHGGWAHPQNYSAVVHERTFIDRSVHITRVSNVTNVTNVTVNVIQPWHAPRTAPAAPTAILHGSAAAHVVVAQPRVIAGAPRPPAEAVRVRAMERARPAPPAARQDNQRPSVRPAPRSSERPAGQPPPYQKPAPNKAAPPHNKKQPPPNQKEKERQQREQNQPAASS